MTIKAIETTKQLPWVKLLGVTANSDEDAIKQLAAIAKRKCYELGETVYKYGQCYFYAELVKGDPTERMS